MRRLHIILPLLFSINVTAADDLSYPKDKNLAARDIAQQALLVMRARLPKNAVSKKNKGKIATLINRRLGRKARVNQFENYINNDYSNGIIKQKLLTIFRRGKLKGTGVLITQYVDEKRAPLLQLWLPKLRKVRRFSAPQNDDYWNGSNLTYGEVFSRKLDDEKHTLMGEQTFGDCLKTLTLSAEEHTKYTKNLPPAQCAHKNKDVYVLKSSTLNSSNWYDFHTSYIDKKSFAVYRTQYYKNKQLIKTVDIDWQNLGQSDPRAVYPAYLYSQGLSNSESLFIVPRETITWDAKIPAKFWSESALRRIKR